MCIRINATQEGALSALLRPWRLYETVFTDALTKVPLAALLWCRQLSDRCQQVLVFIGLHPAGLALSYLAIRACGCFFVVTTPFTLADLNSFDSLSRCLSHFEWNVPQDRLLCH